MTTVKSAQPTGTAIPGRVSFLDGQGELPMIEIATAWSTAEVYLLGGQVTHFQRKNEPPLLFMSKCSRFVEGQPIRGGIPIVLPWFGPREGMAQHGFARTKNWEVKEVTPAVDGSVSVRLRLPDYPEASAFPPFTAEYVVTVNQGLTLQLVVRNASESEELTFENCLHTYLEVGDINAVSVTGLKGTSYLDKVENFARKLEENESLRISSEVDRIYQNTSAPVEVIDPRLGRKIRVEKQSSLSTVVWNPWMAKAQQMPDFGSEEYEQMLCVESGNVASNAIKLPPGQTSTLTVELKSSPLK
jgi:D-hexose-6-phosphate mutarotase